MLRCVKPGCPTRCGSLRTPSCAERMLYYALMLLFAIGLLVSAGMGVRWFKDAGIQEISDPGRVSARSLCSAAKGPTLDISGQRTDSLPMGFLWTQRYRAPF